MTSVTLQVKIYGKNHGWAARLQEVGMGSWAIVKAVITYLLNILIQDDLNAKAQSKVVCELISFCQTIFPMAKN